ncbi:circumsporozoite protein-like [Moschus berezovskii]|uniref:circumsporozoite protein-like n=1 Tax=Moschus berezovskii TaxID=68408 RepID=UPI0024439D02|nr:circumsporozoite protein-like [Moschus berezovskii]
MVLRSPARTGRAGAERGRGSGAGAGGWRRGVGARGGRERGPPGEGAETWEGGRGRGRAGRPRLRGSGVTWEGGSRAQQPEAAGARGREMEEGGVGAGSGAASGSSERPRSGTRGQEGQPRLPPSRVPPAPRLRRVLGACGAAARIRPLSQRFPAEQDVAPAATEPRELATMPKKTTPVRSHVKPRHNPVQPVLLARVACDTQGPSASREDTAKHGWFVVGLVLTHI